MQSFLGMLVLLQTTGRDGLLGVRIHASRNDVITCFDLCPSPQVYYESKGKRIGQLNTGKKAEG